MGYLILKQSQSDEQSSEKFAKDDVEHIVGKSAQDYVDIMSMAPETKKTIIKVALCVSKMLLKAIIARLTTK